MENLKLVMVTPSMAAKMLEKNGSNRRLSKSTLASYVQQMKEHKWRSGTFECLKIAPCGTLLDGQHRLLAIIQSDTCQQLHIAYNVDKSLFDVLDTGKVRSGADVFSIAKIENPLVASATVRGYLLLKRGFLGLDRNSKTAQITNSMVLDEYQRRPTFWKETVSFCIKSQKRFENILPSATIGTTYAYLYDFSPTDSRDFINQLCTGNDIGNSSISVLRQFLLKNKISVSKISSTEKSKCIFKTWNAYRTGKNYKNASFLYDTTNSFTVI
jgi:hypothetical protein